MLQPIPDPGMCFAIFYEYDSSGEFVQLHICKLPVKECGGNHECCCGKEWQEEIEALAVKESALDEAKRKDALDKPWNLDEEERG